jgi:protein JSN1
MTVDDIDQVAGDFLDGEIVDLASDWLGNTVSSPWPYLDAF